MYAVFYNNDIVYGYKEITLEEAETFEIDFVLVDELPPEMTNPRKGYYIKINKDTMQFYYEPIPPQPETPEQKIARLEAELAAAREEIITAYEAIAELYEMMLGGVTT